MSLDGHGGILIYDAATGRPERISATQLISFRIDCPAAVEENPKLIQ
jgi:hypothetical protein